MAGALLSGEALFPPSSLAIAPLVRSPLVAEGVPGSQGKSQKEGQENQGELKKLGGAPLAALRPPGLPDLPSGISLGWNSLKPRCDDLCELGGAGGTPSPSNSLRIQVPN